MSRDTVLTFLMWCSLGAIIGPWVTSNRTWAGLIALAVAVGGTIAMVYPSLTAYWWVVLVVVIALLWSRPNLRDRIRLAGSLAFRALVAPAEVTKERDELARHNQRLRRIIRNLAQDHKRLYRLRESIEIQIAPDGSSVSTRSSEIIAATETVSWIETGYGTTVANPRARGVILADPDITDDEGRPVDYEFYEESDNRRSLLIFLREPLRPGGSRSIRMVRRSPRIWIDLIEHLEDHGRFEPQNEVEEVSLTLWVPASLRITKFRVEPVVGTASIAPDSLSATWSATGLQPRQVYFYRVRCLRV